MSSLSSSVPLMMNGYNDLPCLVWLEDEVVVLILNNCVVDHSLVACLVPWVEKQSCA